jgi:hypothetical protein
MDPAGGSGGGGLQKRKRQGAGIFAKKREEAKKVQPCASLLVFFLQESFAWGEMPGTKAQQIAKLALDDLRRAKASEDDEIEKELEKVASCGDYGRRKGQVHADMIQTVDRGRLPTAKMEPMPISNKKTREGWSNMGLKVVFPHELFAALFTDYPDKFRSCICSGTAVLKEFWQSQEDHPQMAGHPLRDRENYTEKAVPLSFHGDGIPVTGLLRFH